MFNRSDKIVSNCIVVVLEFLDKSRHKKFFMEGRGKERRFKISAINKETWIGKKTLVGKRLTFKMIHRDKCNKKGGQINIQPVLSRKDDKNSNTKQTFCGGIQSFFKNTATFPNSLNKNERKHRGTEGKGFPAAISQRSPS